MVNKTRVIQQPAPAAAQITQWTSQLAPQHTWALSSSLGYGVCGHSPSYHYRYSSRIIATSHGTPAAATQHSTGREGEANAKAILVLDKKDPGERWHLVITPHQWVGVQVQQGNQGGGQGTVSMYKYYNSWNNCIICEFNIPSWHTSKTCPTACRKPNHHKGCNQTNYLQYQAAGYTACM
jgi:hypothetical protein